MDWTRLDFDEIGCVFMSTKLRYDLDCLPFPMKLDGILDMLDYYQVTGYTNAELCRLFQLLKLKSPRSGKENIPSLAQIDKRLTAARDQVQTMSGTFAAVLRKAREKDLIQVWVEYALVHMDVCEQVTRAELEGEKGITRGTSPHPPR